MQYILFEVQQNVGSNTADDFCDLRTHVLIHTELGIFKLAHYMFDKIWKF